MKESFRIGSWLGRFCVLAALIVLPFCRFLLQNRYGLFRIEVAVAIAALALSCSLLAALGRWKLGFHIAIFSTILLMSTFRVRDLLSPLIRIELAGLAAGLALLLAPAMYWMRDNFFRIVLVFAVSAFSVDIFEAVLNRAGPGESTDQTDAKGHVLYLVLDEQLGPGGFPRELPEGARAADTLVRTFARNRFRIYPNAFSNYTTTLDSMSSILNRTILPSRRHYFQYPADSPDPGRFSLRENRLLSEFAARGYRIALYQHRSIDYSRSDTPPDQQVEYWDTLERLAEVEGRWSQKLQWIVGNYQQSDPVMATAAGFFPFRFHSRMAGPLGIGSIWPDRLAGDIVRTREKTLFFVHLLSPHRPYIYGRNGAIRNLDSWFEDDTEPSYESRRYVEKYRRYSEQVQYLCAQLEWFFRSLSRSRLYDSMLIVVHGDHGSRILFRGKAGGGGQPPPDRFAFDRYDYGGGVPDRQDLLNRFSTLLAVKDRGATRGEIIDEPGSVLGILLDTVFREPRRSGELDAGYLFDPAGNPILIPLKESLDE